jgi:nitrate/TMAO reductase-like tetraheme cytochrome c subunit
MKIPKLSKPVWGLVIVVVAIAAMAPMVGIAHFTTTNPRFCLTCHGTGETADVGQPSKVHPDYGEVGCIDCHAEGGGFKHFVTNGYQEGFKAEPERLSQNCERCHESMKTKTDTVGFKYNEKNINFPHQKHFSFGAQCADCHRDISHDLNINQTNRPHMAYCYQCHSSTDSCTKCHPDGPPAEKAVIPPPARMPQTPSADSQQATFEVRCSKCHALYPPTMHNQAEWAPITERMAGYTGSDITPEDAANIVSYLNTVAPPAPTTGGNGQ